ncbi:MAG: aminofutalosine synthase MqnE [Candidatus Sericytochromatia bacterium]|nr:aminofutalosine synthase MqnE [Candidatus Sericytochromatia bacterium]
MATLESVFLPSPELRPIAEKVLAGERLSFDDGVTLMTSHELLTIGKLANHVREQRHGDKTYFNQNFHLNATNVCEASCLFCSFARLEEGMPQAYTMNLKQALQKVEELCTPQTTEIHIVNGLHPGLDFAYYTDLLTAIKQARPQLHIKGFTAVEIHYFAEKYAMTYQQVLEALRSAGLDSLPGGGAEIFAERVRRKICHDKVDADGWLGVHRTAHQMGLRSNCTILYGTIETPEERVDHLLRLRALQDETGGFQTLIPLSFHNDGNRMAKLPSPTGVEDLRMYAVSRLLLDNIAHIKAYWIMIGIKTAQTSLHFGVDDIDGTVKDEKIYHMAGAETPMALSRPELVRLIREAGRVPVERDTLYNILAEEAIAK